MKKILLVEGKDDENVVKHIWKSFNLTKTFEIENKEGIENVLEKTDSILVDGNPDVCLGIIIDADEDLNIQWERIKGILRKADYSNEIIPENPDATGTIIKQEFKPTLGVWIMPDNITNRGMLEDFLEFLVPDKETNPIWAKAVKSSQEVLEEIEEEIRFNDIHLSKARIHAYLAWQKECGKPFGLSITAKYLQAENPNCEKFVEWLKSLFVE